MTEQKPKIGFIGLGLMGSAMVQRLQSVGYELTVMAHRNRKPIEEAVARGAVEAANAAGVAQASDIIMLCVDTTAAVESVMRGDDGVLAGLKEGALVIDFGTSIPGSTRALYQECVPEVRPSSTPLWLCTPGKALGLSPESRYRNL